MGWRLLCFGWRTHYCNAIKAKLGDLYKNPHRGFAGVAERERPSKSLAVTVRKKEIERDTEDGFERSSTVLESGGNDLHHLLKFMC